MEVRHLVKENVYYIEEIPSPLRQALPPVEIPAIELLETQLCYLNELICKSHFMQSEVLETLIERKEGGVNAIKH